MAKIDYLPWVNREKQVGQAYVHASTAEIRVVMAGRQSGKSLTGVAEICEWAMQDPDQILWWVTASHKTDDKAWRDLTNYLPKEVVAKTNLNDMYIGLRNGSGIWIKSAEAPGSMVSEKLHGLVGDEPGLWKSTIWYQGLLPMFNTTKLRVLFISTPRGRNWFYEMWVRGRGPGGARSDVPFVVTEEIEGQKVSTTYQSFHWTSYDSPYRNLAVLSEARRTSPQDLFAQEYLAEPIDNVRGVFKNVRGSIGPWGTPTDTNWLGVDLARKTDFSCYIGMNSKRQVFHIERSQDDWPPQVRRIAALAFKTNASALVDGTGLGDPVAQFMREAGIHIREEVNFSNKSKEQFINALRLSFEDGSMTIPDDPDLIDELESYEYEILPSGKIRYSAPEGKHDDMVVALALANWGARSVPAGGHTKAVTHYYLPRQRGFVSL